MEIVLDQIGHRFNREWIFRNISAGFTSGNAYAILGTNGSGKSTLLQIISGHLYPAAGKVQYTLNDSMIPDEQVFSHISLTAPYAELIEEFTLEEMVSFHLKFRKLINGLDSGSLIEMTGLGRSRGKALKYYSSGMKQRVKLALAILSDVPVVLLDEPASNLDAEGISWYRDLVAGHAADRIFIICSNSQPAEYDFCKETLLINNYSGKHTTQRT